MENSPFIWDNYGRGSELGQVCLEIDFDRLRQRLNSTLSADNASLEYGGTGCRQIFSINYGKISYVSWDEHSLSSEFPPNPIVYSFLKSEKYQKEQELRVALSAIGIGDFVLANGSRIEFTQHLSMGFDFQQAFSDGTICQLLTGDSRNEAILLDELNRLGIAAMP